MRRSLFIAILCIFCLQTIAFAAAPPDISAESACLMVANTRRVLFEKDKDKIMYPASTTKIITLLTALEKGDPNSLVAVSAQASQCDGSSLELGANDRLTLRELLYGMMLVSGNDAAEAVAEHVGGSKDAFVDMMNQSAQRLGAERTHFSNPHGLPDPINHFSTAYDMALMTAAGYKRPEFIEIVSTKKHSVLFANRTPHPVVSTNKLLGAFPGANGVKTGYTEAAGDCLVAAAKRNGVQLIVVVFNDDERWTDAANLLEYGFAMINQSAKL